MDSSTETEVHRSTDGSEMDGWADVNGWMDRWMAGWMDGWADGWIDRERSRERERYIGREN